MLKEGCVGVVERLQKRTCVDLLLSPLDLLQGGGLVGCHHHQLVSEGGRGSQGARLRREILQSWVQSSQLGQL